MSSFENENAKNFNQNILNISRNTQLNITNIGQFNTFKFKHFNNFFNSLFHDKLKSQLINYIHEKNNKSTSIFKNEFLNETLSEKTLSEFNERRKRVKANKKNAIINTKLKNIDSYLSYKANNSTQYKSLDKIYLSKINKSNNSYNKSSSINSKYISKGQNTIPNISNLRTNNSNNKIRLQLDISSLSNDLYKTKKNNFSNTSTTFLDKKIKINKDQQLPKDAANCLLLFLKKNKKYLQKTKKYDYIYEKYKNIIDNIIEIIPDDESNYKKNNYGNMLGYYKRRPMEGNDLLDLASLIWNNYNSKSEKERHFQILSELTKLKGFIDKDVNKKNFYINDFLNKYNINYNKEQFLIFEKFLENFNIKKCEKFLEPGLGIKDMIFKIFEEGEKFENENKEKIKTMPPLNLKSSMVSDDEAKNKIKVIEAYSWLKKNKSLSNKNKHEKYLNLSDTSSYLKEMERQKLVDKPNKTYSLNYNLIVKDISKEIEQVENEIITEKQYNNLQPILINQKNLNNDLFITSNTFLKSNRNEKNIKYLSPDLMNKTRKCDKMNREGLLEKYNIKNSNDKVELKDVKRKLKLTEYIIYNKAKNKLKLKELGKGELFEYSKKEDNDVK